LGRPAPVQRERESARERGRARERERERASARERERGSEKRRGPQNPRQRKVTRHRREANVPRLWTGGGSHHRVDRHVSAARGEAPFLDRVARSETEI